MDANNIVPDSRVVPGYCLCQIILNPCPHLIQAHPINRDYLHPAGGAPLNGDAGFWNTQDVCKQSDHFVVCLPLHRWRRNLDMQDAALKADYLVSLRVGLDTDGDSGRLFPGHDSPLPAEKAAGVFGGLPGKSFKRHIPDSGQFLGGVAYVGWLVALATVRLWRQERTVGLDH